jgi:hypothetical protein
MTARGGTHPTRKVYDIPSLGGPTHLKKVYDEGTVTYLPWKRNATLRAVHVSDGGVPFLCQGR